MILKEEILGAIRKNENAYSVYELQSKVKNGTITWGDLREVFSDAQVHAIQTYKQEWQMLPECAPPQRLLSDSTEIYFWGTKQTGKTCAMGAVLSAAEKEGLMIARSCPHLIYMVHLSNLFGTNSMQTICSLPWSTLKDSIAEMNLQLVDSKKKRHNVTFIDLAGEVVTGIYKIRNNIILTDSERNTVNQVLSYLRNPYNNKIHFFVLEYGSADREVKELKDMDIPNIRQADVLASIAEFLQEEKVLKTSTVGVYGLVSKSDLIDSIQGTNREERPRLASEYVKQNLSAFWNAITAACDEAKVQDVKTISFSIGHVFAQNLVILDDSDSIKIIQRLLLKTKPERKSLFGWLLN